MFGEGTGELLFKKLTNFVLHIFFRWLFYWKIKDQSLFEKWKISSVFMYWE